jgi:hypothetical protein
MTEPSRIIMVREFQTPLTLGPAKLILKVNLGIFHFPEALPLLS